MNKLLLFCVALLGLTTNVCAQSGIFPLTPFNGDTLESDLPLFTWYVTDGSGSNERVSYSFVLVEMGNSQTADEAVNSNIPLVRVDNLNQQQYMYPNDAPALKKEVWYAWQVQKYWANSLVDKSESWKFIIASTPPKKESLKYAKLKRKNDGAHYEVYDGKIYFMMDEKYNTTNIEVSVLDENQRLIVDKVSIDRKDDPNNGAVNFKAQGSNFYELDLGPLNKQGIYEMITFDGKGRKLILPFVIH